MNLDETTRRPNLRESLEAFEGKICVHESLGDGNIRITLITPGYSDHIDGVIRPIHYVVNSQRTRGVYKSGDFELALDPTREPLSPALEGMLVTLEKHLQREINKYATLHVIHTVIEGGC